MSVVLVKKGASLFPLEVTCSRCKSVLKIGEPGDLSVNTLEDDRMANPEREAFIDCPVCNDQINIDSDILDKVLFEYDKVGEWR